MPEPFAGLLQQALGLVREHQYVALFFLIAIEEAGLPLPAPGDLIIAYYGWRAGGDPYEIAQVVLTCALASTTGTLVPYALSRRYGDQVARRVAGWLDVDEARIADIERRVDRNGFLAVLVVRLVPGLRVAASLVGGTANVPLAAFSPAVFLAAAAYWTAWVLLGAIVGPRVEDVVSPAYLRYIVIAIPLVVTGGLFARVIWARRARSRR